MLSNFKTQQHWHGCKIYETFLKEEYWTLEFFKRNSAHTFCKYDALTSFQRSHNTLKKCVRIFVNILQKILSMRNLKWQISKTAMSCLKIYDIWLTLWNISDMSKHSNLSCSLNLHAPSLMPLISTFGAIKRFPKSSISFSDSPATYPIDLDCHHFLNILGLSAPHLQHNSCSNPTILSSTQAIVWLNTWPISSFYFSSAATVISIPMPPP